MVEQSLQIKKDRSQAIIDGQNTLNFMTNLMKDVMTRARLVIKAGML